MSCLSTLHIGWGLCDSVCLVLVCRGRYSLGGVVHLFILGLNLVGEGPVRGKDLPDHATIAECGLARDSTLDVLPRCCCGSPTDKGSAEAYIAEHLATVRRKLMRHLSQEMGARVTRLQVCSCSLSSSCTRTSTPCSIAHAWVIRENSRKFQTLGFEI